MKHCILAKFDPKLSKEEKNSMYPNIRALFERTLEIDGITGVELHTNCVDRPNRFDVLIAIEMEKSALPLYDNCEAHKEWLNNYGPLLEKKAIFDFEG